MLENPFNLPESFEESYEHYHVPPQYRNWLIISDLHIPYHNIRAITESLNYGIAKNIDAILINGDLIDFFWLSHFEKNPLKRTMQEELIAVEEFLRVLRGIAPVFFKFGNHDERLVHFLRRHALVLIGTEEFELENLLHLRANKIEWVKDQRIVYVGHLPVVHGHELRLANVSVNPARSLFLKTKKTALCGHLHRTSQHNETALDGKLISTWSVGHLGEAHPEYARINGWNWGCARVEVNSDGDFEVINLRINDNKLFRS